MLSRPSTLLLGTLAALTLTSTRARADACAPPNGLSTCVDADNLWVHPGTGPYFSLGPTLTTPVKNVSFGVVFSYLSRPLSLVVRSPDPAGTPIHVLDNMLDATLLWSVGITDRFELTAAAPVTIVQDGAGLGPVLGTNEELVRSVIRDPRFGVAFAILPRARAGSQDGPALTARLEFGVPVGTKTAFGGGSTMTAVPTVVYDHRIGRLDLSAELGARIRGETTIANAVIGSQLVGALGASFNVLPRGMLSAGAEAFALYTLSSQPAASDGSARSLVPAEWIASVNSAPFMGGDVSFSLGGGGPLPLTGEVPVTTPRFRLNLGLRYAPIARDADADGVLDRDDKCPDQVEDRDGFQDDDGCPELDNDHDRIPDTRDRCRDEAEDFDGFQDDDGCPEFDDDEDGIPDDKDKCRNEPEDKDNFEDEDGCPDPDNDEDGIPDDKDRCPNGAEDMDGFKDEDGCPDPDNDVDQVPDTIDQCPNEPEDRDNFRDDDGCPDPDNDEDGIPDDKDQCPVLAETIDGKDDDDGCPEKGARSLVHWEGDRIVLEGAARFAPGSDKLTPALETQAKMIALAIKGRQPIASVIIEAYADRAGDTSPRGLDLAGRRALAIKTVLVAAGLAEDHIVAAAGDPALKRPPGAPPFDITAVRAPQQRKKKR